MNYISPWKRLNPITKPQEPNFPPNGSIPIHHKMHGHPIAWVAPQKYPEETDQLSRMVQQAPAMYRVILRLISELEKSPSQRNELRLYNAMTEARYAIDALEVCE